MLKREYEILVPLIQNPWKSFTFKEIKMLSRKKSESYVYNSLKKFVKINILKSEKIGNSVLYSLNLGDIKTQSYLGFISEYISLSKYPFLLEKISKIIDKIPLSFYTLIVTGSYVRGSNKKDSDIDLVIIIPDSVENKKVYSELSYYCENNIPEVHLHVFKKSEFLEMLSNKEPNYGKEIAKNNTLLFGAESYYKILWGAIQSGFAG